LKHTCTVSEFYLVKADIEYKLHNNLETLKTINEARKTDLADRYMNNICVKYLMKCEKPDIGENVLRMFMRDDASLYELQNHWYIIEAAKSFLKQRNFASGLKHLDFVNKQFLDFQGNEFDFHTYCLRKWTLKEYIELI
jgi:N-alpha-acetyltransferase 15/16, NatA auxiliary subunit